MKLWARYVDDIFVLFPNDHNHNEYLVLHTLSDFNKFSSEFEQKLPFLDVLVCRTESNFEYSVCRKPTNKNALLHFFSFHDIIKIIKSVFSGLCLRALRVCSSINLNSEIHFCIPYSAIFVTINILLIKQGGQLLEFHFNLLEIELKKSPGKFSFNDIYFFQEGQQFGDLMMKVLNYQ